MRFKKLVLNSGVVYNRKVKGRLQTERDATKLFMTIPRAYKLRIFLIPALIALGLFFAPSKSAYASSYSVTNSLDSGAGSLREAITNANASPGADTITFAIAGAGQHTITLTTALPQVTEQLLVDGLSQSGSVCNGASTSLNVAIDAGNQSNPFSFGSGATSSQIQGLALFGSAENSSVLSIESDDTIVRCNFIGTTDGLTVSSTQLNSDWLNLAGDNATIGGSSASDLNVILGLGNAGINNTSASPSQTITINHNYIGVGVDGSTIVGSPISGLYLGSIYTSATITNNVITTTNDQINFVYSASGSSGILVDSNYLGVDSTGMNAAASAGNAVFLVGNYSSVQITNNVAFANSNLSALHFKDGSISGMTIEDNYINTTADGSSEFTGALAGIDSEYEPGHTDWLIDNNVIYGGGLGSIAINGVSNLVAKNNTLGMNAARTSCFAGNTHGIYLGESVIDSVIGGPTSGDANYICTDNNDDGIRGKLTLVANLSILRNIVTSGGAAIEAASPGLNAPIIRSVEDDGVSTTVSIDADLPAGDYRLEFFQNPTALNGNGFPMLTQFLSQTTITSDGSGVQNYALALAGTGHTYLAATATVIDLSTDGYGTTSPISTTELQTQLTVSTSDGVTSVEEGTVGHEITQTITNTGPSSVSELNFTLASTTCFDVTGVVAGGNATDTGAYAAAQWTGLLESGQSITLTFTGDTSCVAGGTINFNHQLNTVKKGSQDIQQLGVGSYDTSDTTSIVAPSTVLSVETTDNTGSVLQGTTGHQFTQTLTNTGPRTITTVNYDLASTTCFSISNVATSGTATNAGAYSSESWTGSLEPGQALILTFTGDVSCLGGDDIVFTHNIISIFSSAVQVIDSTGDDDTYSNATSVASPVTDVSGSKILTDPANFVPGGTVHYQLTFTNNGPQDIDLSFFDGTNNPFETSLFMDYMPADLTFEPGSSSNIQVTCSPLAPASEAGPLLANHSDTNLIMCTYSGAGTLSEGESITTTIAATISNDSALNFTNYMTTGWPQYDPDQPALGTPFNDIEACGGSTDMLDCYSYLGGNNNFISSAAVSDVTVTKTLVNPEDVSDGNTIYYDLRIHNKGPMDLPLSEITNLTDLFPGDNLSYIAVDNSDFQCNDLGLGTISYLGPAGQDHAGYNLLICQFEGEGGTIPVDSDLTLRLSFTVLPGTTNFTNYASLTVDGPDPDVASLNNLFANAEGDILDSIDNENFSKASTMRVASNNPDPGNVSSGTDGNNGLAGTGQDSSRLLWLALPLLAISFAFGTIVLIKKRKD